MITFLFGFVVGIVVRSYVEEVKDWGKKLLNIKKESSK